MSVKYDATGTPTEKEEMNSLLVQSFSMIIDHNGRCAQGANGRNFLMQVAMLQFFKTMGNS